VRSRGVAGLAVAGVAVCCGLPLVLAAGSAATIAGLGLGSWLLIVAGAVIAAAGAWRWRTHRRACAPALMAPATGEAPDPERPVRRAAFDALCRGEIPTIGDLAHRTHRSNDQVEEALSTLVDEGRAQLDGSRVVGALGISARPTRHQLALDGVALHTWCALDAIGIPAALRAHGIAHTACPTCGHLIEIGFEQGRPLAAGENAVVWLPEKKCTNVVEEFCPEANLFCGPDHLGAWRQGAGDPVGRALSLGQAAEVGRQLWADVAP
jgi:hypothetical protein